MKKVLKTRMREMKGDTFYQRCISGVVGKRRRLDDGRPWAFLRASGQSILATPHHREPLISNRCTASPGTSLTSSLSPRGRNEKIMYISLRIYPYPWNLETEILTHSRAQINAKLINPAGR